MGSAMSRNFQREELAEFKNLPDYYNNIDIDIPERPENRTPTDRKFLIVFILMIVALVPFMVYTLYYSDIYRYFGYYDQCGNICGKENYKYNAWECTGKDVRNQMLLQVGDVNGTKAGPRLCVSECSPGYEEVSGYCLRQTYIEGGTSDYDVYGGYQGRRRELKDELESVTWEIIFACCVSLGIGLTTLLLFRVATEVLVWSILMATITLLSILAGTLWYLYNQADKSYSTSLLVPAVISSIILFILLCMVIFLRKRISLVIALFKEAMKATFAMPLLLTIPILVILGEFMIIIAFTVTTLYMASAGVLTEVAGGYLEYKYNTAMSIAIVLNACATIWAVQFVNAMQFMIIAGAVSKWYFARNKSCLDSPIKNSTLITFKYHLGSVAFGSLIMGVVIVIRTILSVIFRKRCFTIIERFLQFLSRHAFILTAMHGQPYFKSGRRAVQITIQNVVNITSIDFIGDFILFLAHVLVVSLSLVAGYLIFLGKEYIYFDSYTFYIVFCVSIIVAAICFSIFGAAISTIFLCFCEDCMLNDGMYRPYAMSRALMQFMESSIKVFPTKTDKY